MTVIGVSWVGGLAAVVTSGLVYAGLGAVAVPILIHLLNRRRYRQVRWGAMAFLLEAQRRNRRRVRVEELILLALRCLAMILAGVMLARWFLRPESLAAVLGSAGRTERIIVLDDSYSTRLLDRHATSEVTSGESPTVFARARLAVGTLIAALRESSPGDPLTMILSSRPKQSWRNEPSLGFMDARAFEADLEILRPSNQAGHMQECMATVRKMLDERQSQVNATVYVISDFQQVDWPGGGGTGNAQQRGPMTALAGWAGGDRHLQTVLVDVGTDAPANLAVRDLVPLQAQVVAGIEARYAVRVSNFGPNESEATSLQILVGEAPQPPAAVPAIAPGQTVEVPLEVTYPVEGSDVLSVELPTDPLLVDNRRWRVEPVARAVRVLVVNGEAAADPAEDEVFLLNVGLRPEGPQFSGNEITVIDENELEATDVEPFHLVVLANVFRIGEELAERLTRYVSGGGGLAVFLGDQVDAEVYNRLLYREGRGVLPARLGEVIGFDPVVSVVVADVNHPLTTKLAHSDVNLFAGTMVWQCFACELPEVSGDGAATRPTNGAADLFNGVNTEDTLPSARAATRPTDEPSLTRVLLRLTDAEKHPLMLERSFGRGRVLLFTATADKEWTDLANRPVFVVLAQEMAQFLARQPARGGSVLVGQPVDLPLDAERFQPRAMVQPPSYPAEPAAAVESRPDGDSGLPRLHWVGTDEAGVYRFELTPLSGPAVIEPVAVNVDTRESDLRRVPRSALVASMAELRPEYVTAADLAHLRDAEVRQEMWPAMLVLLLVVLMGEQALAWYFGAGRSLSALWQGAGK